VSEVIEELVSEYNIEFLEKQLNPLIISASQASASQVAFVK
jgi:hypothetical protein